jgi:hypothetical protein
MTLKIPTFNLTISDTQCLCRVSFCSVSFMLSVIMLNVVMLNVVALSIIQSRCDSATFDRITFSAMTLYMISPRYQLECVMLLGPGTVFKKRLTFFLGTVCVHYHEEGHIILGWLLWLRHPGILVSQIYKTREKRAWIFWKSVTKNFVEIFFATKRLKLYVGCVLVAY